MLHYCSIAFEAVKSLGGTLGSYTISFHETPSGPMEPYNPSRSHETLKMSSIRQEGPRPWESGGSGNRLPGGLLPGLQRRLGRQWPGEVPATFQAPWFLLQYFWVSHEQEN